ncbi:hypothetical protein D1872_350910 [compost metagenome]
MTCPVDLATLNHEEEAFIILAQTINRYVRHFLKGRSSAGTINHLVQSTVCEQAK